jgi:two-component system chemotaxis response regulator CheB
MTDPLRVLIVDDSTTLREHLSNIVDAAPNCSCVGTASDGREAIELCQRLRPDVVSMDMMLPVMSGLAATEYIMAHCPTPILIVSSSFNRGEVFRTYDALAAGALDVFEKPTGQEPAGEWERAYLRQLRLVSRVRVITHPRAKLSAWGRTSPEVPARGAIVPSGQSPRVIAIGASTGGPGALVKVLSPLSPNTSFVVLVVMHLSPAFAAEFANWLDAQIALPVAYARDREALSELAGCVRLAPPNSHLCVEGERLRLSDAPERHSCRPSVDALFESLAQSHGPRAVGCLLTGMGRDGASGLLRMRQAGAHTVAQGEQSCVVFGMPREAIALGAARDVLNLEQIGSMLATGDAGLGRNA